MAEPVRKKVRWPSKRRKGKSRVWKSRWVTIKQRTGKSSGKAAPKPQT
jgi:hypothetical protein